MSRSASRLRAAINQLEPPPLPVLCPSPQRPRRPRTRTKPVLSTPTGSLATAPLTALLDEVDRLPDRVQALRREHDRPKPITMPAPTAQGGRKLRPTVKASKVKVEHVIKRAPVQVEPIAPRPVIQAPTTIDLRAIRAQLGLTQEGLAHAIGVTVSTVNRWENGHMQPSRLAQRGIAALLLDREAQP